MLIIKVLKNRRKSFSQYIVQILTRLFIVCTKAIILLGIDYKKNQETLKTQYIIFKKVNLIKYAFIRQLSTTVVGVSC
jgi:hypothetical protein